ncbi:MAG: hypothetical protein LDL30_04330 [Desulfovibrio sp.]|nr:hypothetical protein [Desulfovibrio sp.]MCA1986528.1 hypothetical protein [Desulfovibrio sp.]
MTSDTRRAPGVSALEGVLADDARWELGELGELAAMLHGAERATPRPGLVSRVMSAVPLRRPGLQGRLQDWYQRQFGVSAWLPGRIIATAAGRCHLFFYFVGLLHLGMAAVLAVELQGYAHLFPSWISRQPALSCAMALLLLCLGVLLSRRTRYSKVLARLGLGVYFIAVLGNSLGIATTFAAHGAVWAAVSLAGCGIILGSFLGTMLFTCAGDGRHV